MNASTRATHWPKIERTTNRAMKIVSGRRLALAVVATCTCSVGLIMLPVSADPSPTVTADKTTLKKGEVVDFSTTNTDPSQIAAIFIGQGPSDTSALGYASLNVNNLTNPFIGFRWCRFEEFGDFTQPRTLTVRLYDKFEDDIPASDIEITFDEPYLAQVQVTLEASTNKCPWADSLAMGTVGQEYSSTVAAVSAYFVLADGTLPAGLTLNLDGTITGTPSDPGEFTFTVYADDFFRDYFNDFTIIVNEPNSRPRGGWLSFALPQPAELPDTL